MALLQMLDVSLCHIVMVIGCTRVGGLYPHCLHRELRPPCVRQRAVLLQLVRTELRRQLQQQPLPPATNNNGRQSPIGWLQSQNYCRHQDYTEMAHEDCAPNDRRQAHHEIQPPT